MPPDSVTLQIQQTDKQRDSLGTQQAAWREARQGWQGLPPPWALQLGGRGWGQGRGRMTRGRGGGRGGRGGGLGTGSLTFGSWA